MIARPIYTDGNTFSVKLNGTIVRDDNAGEGGGASRQRDGDNPLMLADRIGT